MKAKPMALRAWSAALAAALFCVASPARAAECAAKEVCASSANRDYIELRDGAVLCGTIVYRDEGQSLIIVDDAHRNRSIPWSEITCLGQRARVTDSDSARPTAADEAPPPQPFTEDSFKADEPSDRRIWLEWDVRLAATTFFKRYVQGDASAWSWGMSGGLGFGAAVHYAVGAPNAEGFVRWSDLEFGLAGSVTYGKWYQVNAGDAAVIEQDVSLRLGARFRLGKTRASGNVIGISWLPTYADFYGRQVKTEGAINPLGLRVTFDLGSTPGRLRQALVFRVALSFLPYVGRLPTMLCLSAGIAIH